MALTRITQGVIKPNQNYDTHNINSTGIITATGANISGNMSVGGVLTYEDVTNIDSIGIMTARTGIKVLAGGINAVGVVTATSFVGSGLNINGDITDAKGNIRRIPLDSYSSSHTLVVQNAGETVYISSGGVTIPSGVFSAGDAITIINDSGSNQTITCSAVTTYLAGDTSAKSSLTLKGRAMATFYFATASVVYGSGAGLE